MERNVGSSRPFGLRVECSERSAGLGGRGAEDAVWAGADAEGAVPLLRSVAVCAPPRVPEEGLLRLGGRGALQVARPLRRSRASRRRLRVSEQSGWYFALLRQGLSV